MGICGRCHGWIAENTMPAHGIRCGTAFSDNCGADVAVTWVELGEEASTLVYDEDESGDSV